jgi:UDP-glucose 4-epimerase
VNSFLILGHKGFIGSHLTAALNRSFSESNVAGLSPSDIDLTQPESVSQLSRQFSPHTTLIICSAIKRQLGDSLDAFKKNVSMVEHICRALQIQPIERVVFMSSAAVYGEDIHNEQISETSPIHLRTYYGMAKYISECLLKKTIDEIGRGALVMLRPPLVYGPGDVTRSYGPSQFLWSAKLREPLTFWGDGEEYREFLFVDDLVQIICKLISLNATGIFNVTSGTSYTFKEVLKMVEEETGVRIQINSRERTKDKVDNKFVNKKISSVLDSFSFTPVRKGVRYTWEREF